MSHQIKPGDMVFFVLNLGTADPRDGVKITPLVGKVLTTNHAQRKLTVSASDLGEWENQQMEIDLSAVVFAFVPADGPKGTVKDMLRRERDRIILAHVCSGSNMKPDYTL